MCSWYLFYWKKNYESGYTASVSFYQLFRTNYPTVDLLYGTNHASLNRFQTCSQWNQSHGTKWSCKRALLCDFLSLKHYMKVTFSHFKHSASTATHHSSLFNIIHIQTLQGKHNISLHYIMLNIKLMNMFHETQLMNLFILIHFIWMWRTTEKMNQAKNKTPP